MCGYVSNSLRNAVVGASAARNAEKARAAGNVFAVARVQKNGKTVVLDMYRNLSQGVAETKRDYVAGLNPGNTYVVVS